MIEQAFKLVPFPATHIPAIRITGTVFLENRVLGLQYLLSGDIEAVLLPPASRLPSRKHELWKATCFEFFLAIRDQPGYWEFNMSPSGNWNAYRMDAYRRIGFREETRIAHLPFAFKKGSDGFFLDVSLDLTSFIRHERQLQMGITAIIQAEGGSETYWALAHPAPDADFHLRESFILAPVEQTPPLGQSARLG
jgi:hypothetical protein